MHPFRLAALTSIPLLAGLASAQSLTVVNEPWTGESSHAEMLSSLFGGTFTTTGQTTGINAIAGGSTTVDTGYSNGSITFTRIADFGDSAPINLRDVAGSDTTWGEGSYRAQAITGFSSVESHTAGIIGADGVFQTVLDPSMTELTTAIHPDHDFTWAIQTSNGRQYAGNPVLNDHGQDQMVSYAMYDETNAMIGAILFFEDWHGPGSDYDYNDFAVLLTLAPTPQAALLGALGLGGAGLITGRRRRTQL